MFKIIDSTKNRVYHLNSLTSKFTHFFNSKLCTAGRIGPAGIAVLPNSDLIIGLYSEGTLVRATIDKEGDKPAFSQLNLQRRLENPDGLYPLPNGRLLVLEVTPISGNGRLSIIDLLARPPYPVTTIVNDLASPLNLTLRNNELFITESRIRHLLLPDGKSPEPDMFFIRRVNLQALL